jgi:hypothetical protein
MILAIELVADKAHAHALPAGEKRGLRAYRRALEEGVLLRPLGEVLYWMRPTASTKRLAAAGARHRRRHRGGLRLMRSVRHFVDLRSRGPVRSCRSRVAHWCACCAGPWRSRALFNGDGHDYEAELRIDRQARRDARACLRAAGRQRIAAGDHAGAGHRARREDGPDPAEGDRTRRGAHRAGGDRAHRGHASTPSAPTSAARTGAACSRRPASRADARACRNCCRRARSAISSPPRPAHAGSCSIRAPFDAGAVATGRGRITVPAGGPGRRLSERDLAAAAPPASRACAWVQRILRTETAALAAIAGLNALYGDWR